MYQFREDKKIKICQNINILLYIMQVLKAEPYLELSSGQSAHCYQLFVEKDPNIEIPTVQVEYLGWLLLTTATSSL